jgi:NADH:ubiquinone oxidoreductase subunit 3 (subunit A)
MSDLVFHLVLFTVAGVTMVAAPLMIGRLLRPKLPNAEKDAVYECGEPTIGSSFIQFDLRFYTVALLFIVFDVEVAFFFPWTAMYGNTMQLTDTQMTPDARIELSEKLLNISSDDHPHLNGLRIASIRDAKTAKLNLTAEAAQAIQDSVNARNGEFHLKAESLETEKKTTQAVLLAQTRSGTDELIWTLAEVKTALEKVDRSISDACTKDEDEDVTVAQKLAESPALDELIRKTDADYRTHSDDEKDDELVFPKILRKAILGARKAEFLAFKNDAMLSAIADELGVDKADVASRFITAEDARSMGWLAFADIAVFFGVLLVGFAYVWKRGDLEWVRAVS